MVNLFKQVKNIFKSKSKEVVITKKVEEVVYWTLNGKNYHTDKNCISLMRSKDIQEGNISECPKEIPCCNCK